jgi:hypothetical protein
MPARDDGPVQGRNSPFRVSASQQGGRCDTGWSLAREKSQAKVVSKIVSYQKNCTIATNYHSAFQLSAKMGQHIHKERKEIAFVSLPTSASSRSSQNYAALLGMDIPGDLVDACAQSFSVLTTEYGVGRRASSRSIPNQFH